MKRSQEQRKGGLNSAMFVRLEEALFIHALRNIWLVQTLKICLCSKLLFRLTGSQFSCCFSSSSSSSSSCSCICCCCYNSSTANRQSTTSSRRYKIIGKISSCFPIQLKFCSTTTRGEQFCMKNKNTTKSIFVKRKLETFAIFLFQHFRLPNSLRAASITRPFKQLKYWPAEWLS